MNKSVVLLISIILVLAGGNTSVQGQVEKASDEIVHRRFVNGNLLVSKETPAIEIEVSKEFSFAGRFEFEIIANSDEYPEEMQGKPVAAGERMVFVSADENKNIHKLFIAQFEGFLAENEFIYHYNFDTADFIGKNKYRHNTWFYDSKKSAEENPANEDAKTRAYLQGLGFKLEDQFMMSRFVGLASEDRKNEIILFYIEMLEKTLGYPLEEYENNLSPKEAESIRDSFVKRSKNSFSIIKG